MFSAFFGGGGCEKYHASGVRFQVSDIMCHMSHKGVPSIKWKLGKANLCSIFQEYEKLQHVHRCHPNLFIYQARQSLAW